MNCEYGCGNIANYTMTNGKRCCEPHFNKCPKIKEKNSKGVKKSHQNNKRTYEHLDGVRNWSVGKTALDDGRIKANKKNPSKSAILNWMLKYKPYECEICKLETWNEKYIRLHIDHIDGNRNNNDLKNLRWLCPNCHSQTPTYCGKNNTGKKKVSDEELIKAIESSRNVREALTRVNLAGSGNRFRVKVLMEKYKLKLKQK